MADDLTPAPEAGNEVVQSEVIEQTEAPEEVDSTEGQDESQPAEAHAEADAEEKSKSQKRRERRKAAREAAERELEEAKDRARRAEAELKRRSAVRDAEPPKEAEFADYDEYRDARSAWAARRGMAEEDVAKLEQERDEHQKAVQSVLQRRQAASAKNFAEQVEDGRAKYADFDEVVMRENLPISQGMLAEFGNSDRAADIAYHLGTHPDLAAKISAMEQEHPALMVVALQTLEAVLPEAAPKPRTKTAAPDPVTRVRGSGVVNTDPAKMTPAEYRAWRQSGGTY